MSPSKRLARIAPEARPPVRPELVRRYVFEFTVEGKGFFPLDMLRYDHCWPIDGESVQAMHTPDYNAPGFENEPRRVRLAAAMPMAMTDPLPTAARWASFGWRVVEYMGQPWSSA